MRVERRQDLANISNELLLGTAEVDHTHSRSRVDKVNGRRRVKPVVVVVVVVVVVLLSYRRRRCRRNLRKFRRGSGNREEKPWKGLNS